MSRAHVSASSPAKAKRPTVSDLFTDFLCCWLIAVGVLLAMRQLFRFDNPVAALMIRAAIILALTILLTRRWWVLPSVLSGIALCVVLFALATETLSSLLLYLRGFFLWWMNQFPVSSRYNLPGNILLVDWIIAILVCCIVYLFVRRIRSFLFIVVVSTALIVIISVNDFHDNLGALAFIAAGSVPLIARNYHQRLFLNLDEVFIKLRKLMIPGIILCTVCALLAHAVVPENTMSWKNKKLSDALEKIEGSKQAMTDEPFTLQSSGLQPNADELGGDVIWTHDPVLKVNTNAPTLLKGAVYETYTGKGWAQADNLNYSKMNSVMNDDIYALEGYSLNYSENSPLRDALQKAYANVTMLPGGYSLFTSGLVLSAAPVSDQATLLFNSRSEIISQSQLPKNFQYQYHSLLLNRQFQAVTDIIGTLENEEVYPQDIKAQYTQLPDSLPASVSEKAQSITQNIESPYAKMVALENYLRSNYEYTLTPGNVPEKEDFVDYFLKSGKGYCVYYASAMAVMARTLGVPSRFVIGFGLKQTSDGWTAYTDTAHAWVECYICGVGWVTFDPTAGSDYSRQNTPDTVQTTLVPAQTYNISETTGTTAATAATESTNDTSETSAAGAVQPAGHLSALWYSLLAAAAVLLLLAAAALHMLRQSKAYLPERMRRRYPQNGACADRYYTDILRQLSLLGYAPAPSETMYQHGQRIGDEIRTFGPKETAADGDLIEKAFAIVMNWRYGEMSPSDSELKEIAEVHEALDNRLKSSMSPLKYALIRLLFAK